jgi:hypothetical protein
MGETLSVSIDTSKDVAEPTLEEEAAKYESDNFDSSADDRPEWLPEKFKSPEDMAKAYSELEKKLGSRSNTNTEENVEQTLEEPERQNANDADEGEDNDEETETVEQKARQVTEKAGLDFDELSASYWENGELNESQYKKLEEAGIPKSLVDQFITGQEALIASTRNTVFESVGGEDAYNSITSWAADNFSEDEISAYNAAVNSGNTASAMMAVKGLKARYDAEVGFEPSREVRGQTAKAGASVYRSVAELEKDMSDPRYREDPAFRRDVERKLGRSDIF